MNASALRLAMAPAGHWHFSHSKMLSFTVTDTAGRPLAGLQPTVTVRTPGGRLDHPPVTDLGTGTYTAEYTAGEIGAEYSTGYAVLFAASHQGQTAADAWPVEVVRDGREDIVKADRYLYHVRYGWHPGQPVASDERPVDLYFEPRRALPEGRDLNRQQPWRNPTEHLPGLEARVVVQARDGGLRDEVPVRYTGLGVYHAARLFTPAEVADGRVYDLSLVFTDPYNGVTVDVEDNAYSLTVSPADARAA